MKFTTEYLLNPQLEQCPNCQGRGYIYTPFVAVPMEGTAAETKDIVFVCSRCEGTGVLNPWITQRIRTLMEEADDEVKVRHWQVVRAEEALYRCIKQIFTSHITKEEMEMMAAAFPPHQESRRIG